MRRLWHRVRTDSRAQTFGRNNERGRCVLPENEQIVSCVARCWARVKCGASRTHDACGFLSVRTRVTNCHADIREQLLSHLSRFRRRVAHATEPAPEPRKGGQFVPVADEPHLAVR